MMQQEGGDSKRKCTKEETDGNKIQLCTEKQSNRNKTGLHISLKEAMKLLNDDWVQEKDSCQITKNLLDAVLVHHANSAHFRFGEINECNKIQEGENMNVNNIQKQMEEQKLSDQDQELKKIIQQFCKQHSFEVNLHAHGACGIQECKTLLVTHTRTKRLHG